MSAATINELNGNKGKVHVRKWSPDDPSCVVLLAHGIGEHSGRYEHVADRLTGAGACVYAPDHLGHGLSEGERADFDSLEDMVDDLASVGLIAAEEHPGLPIVLLGHSMGGLIVTRLAQRDPSPWAGMALSGPAIGGNPELIGLLDLDPIPDVPIDPAALSRDPRVGEAYMSDDLVYHGPLLRSSLGALKASIEAVAVGSKLDGLPVLWMHGSDDPLLPLELARTAVEDLGSSDLESEVYEGARHEIFNETNSDEVLDRTIGFIGRVTAR